MGTFIRVTLVVAAALAVLAALILLLKLLVAAAIVAAVIVGFTLIVRATARRLDTNRPPRVTALTARR